MRRQQTPSKMISKEIILVIFTVVSMLAITVLTTVSGAGFDPSRLTAKDVYTNIILNATFVLVSLLVAIPYGRVTTMCKKTPEGYNGKYLTAFDNFNNAYNAIVGILYQFSQWHFIKYKKEVREKQYRYLSEHNIPQIENIFKLNRPQIESLTKPQMFTIDGKDFYFGAMSKRQVDACLKVYDGKISLHKLPDSYFLYIDGKAGASFYEQAYYEARVQAAYVTSRVMSKVLIGLVISCAITSLVIDELVFDKYTVLKMVTNLIARLMTIGQSLYSGFIIGQNIIYRKCYYIDGKTSFLTEFRTDATFTYKDPQILAKEQYDEERSVLNEPDSGTEAQETVESTSQSENSILE